MHTLKTSLRNALIGLALLIAGLRLVTAIAAWRAGNSDLITAYAFSVLFPAVILLLLGLAPGTRTREGLVMRCAAMLQLELLLAIPRFALHLALGLPVAFLAVELVAVYLPALRDRIEHAVIA